MENLNQNVILENPVMEKPITIDSKDLINWVWKALHDRTINPEGAFDRAGRFYLEYTFDCCDHIRTPSRAYPYSYMVRARTKKHVKSIFENEEKHFWELFNYIGIEAPNGRLDRFGNQLDYVFGFEAFELSNYPEEYSIEYYNSFNQLNNGEI